MKKLFIAALVCAAAMLASCGKADTDSSEFDLLGDEEVTTTVTTVTTTVPTTAETTAPTTTVTTTETTTTTVTTTSIKFEPPPSDDPEVGYGQVFQIQTEPATTTARPAVTTKKTTTAPKPVQTVESELKVTAKIDQLFTGLRDKEAEAEAARREQERLEQERREKEEQEKKEQEEKDRQDSSSADSSDTDSSDTDSSDTDSSDTDSSDTDSSDTDSSDIDSSDTEDVSAPIMMMSAAKPAAVKEKEFPAEFTAVTYEDFKGYMAFFYEPNVVDRYLKQYPKSFFDSKVLILNTVGQAAGKTCELKFKKATGNSSTKVITMDVDRNELKDPEKVTSTLLVQVAVSKTDYQKYGTKGTKWKFTFRKYYDYALAKAALDKCGWNLKSAFNYCASIKYYGHTADMPQVDTVSTEWYADYGFKNGKGNCYVMAAMFCEMARLLGYDCHQISGKVPLVNGGYGPHSWVEIYIDGKTYICDPDFTNETKLDGYMKQYGQSGTWIYVKLKDMSL